MGSFLKIAPQCCDAGSYISYGSECAAKGQCYGELRPIGNYLWFALPQKLGWPLESLITANFVLMFFSVFLSAMAFGKLTALNCTITKKIAVFFVLLLLSFTIHAIFLWPTIFNTLSDPPSSLLLLTSIWFLILAHCNARQRLVAVMQFLAAGFCMGFAVWLRAFYLYPVFIGLGAYFLLWLFSRNKKIRDLLLLAALFPIGVQYIVMHNAYGTYSYLKEETASSWSAMHLNQPFVGYDTIFPRNDYVWHPQHCNSNVGIQNGMLAKDYNGVGCIIMERLYFYLGTYESRTYIFSDKTNQLVSRYVESIGAPKTDWRTVGLQFESDVVMAANGENTADKLTVTTASPGGKGDVVMWVMLAGNASHTFSVWLWSPIAKTINLAIKRHDDDAIIALQQFTLTPEPTRYSITGTTLDTAVYDVDIGRTPYKNAGISFGTQPGDFFYAWGAQLEAGASMTEYNPSGAAGPDSVRKWRPALLILNLSMLIMAFVAIIKSKEFWLQQRTGICILIIMIASAAESVAIIPEQRFAIGWMIFFWLLATVYVSNFVLNFIMRNKAAHNKCDT